MNNLNTIGFWERYWVILPSVIKIMIRKATTFIELILGGLSILALCVYFYVAFSRIAYPFTIEWVESNTFLHVVRVLEGKPIYITPSYEFIPMIYTPFYYYVVAIFAKITGEIMFSMRLVSVISSLFTFTLIYTLCRLRQITPQLSIIAVGLFAASYAVTGFWFDVGRVDMLNLALLLMGYVLIIAPVKRDITIGVIAGFVFFLSFATKQTAILAIPFLLFYLILTRRWMKALWLITSFALSCGLFVIFMNTSSQGWFWTYIYKIPSAHPISFGMVTHDFWVSYIFPTYPWVIIVVILAVIVMLILHDKLGAFYHGVFFLTFFLPLSIMSITSMAKQWGYINGLLPIAVAFSIITVEAYQMAANAMISSRNSTWNVKVLYYLISFSIISQFIGLRYDFRTQIPTQASLSAGKRIISILRVSKSPIFVPTSPYLLYMAGQQTHFQVSSLGDLSLAANNNPALLELLKNNLDRINEYILSNSIKTAILPNANWYDGVFSIESGYECESLVNDYPPLITLTGAKSYLDRICRYYGETTQ